MIRSLALLMTATFALAACSGGASDVGERFAEFCETDTMFKGSEPCRNPDSVSDEQKKRIMEGMQEFEQGMDEMQQSLDAAVEEAQRQADEAAGQ